MTMNIRRAQPGEAAKLTEISMRSKQSNGYDDAFMAACRDELTISETALTQQDYWVAETDTVCGVACLTSRPGTETGEVHSLFVDPDAQRLGIGHALLSQLISRARASGLTVLELHADPEAVAFYAKHGFSTVGQVPSGSIAGRFIPLMRIRLSGLE